MSTLNAVSTSLTEVSTVALKIEASWVHKPIVYQCHPEEFVPSEHNPHPMRLTWRSFVPNAQSGIAARWAFLETDEHELHLRNVVMTDYLRQQTTFEFLTADDYYSALPICEQLSDLDDSDRQPSL
jgi:hypothetical protein